jgi:predicted RNase H-like HicB family nuclease
MSTIIYVARVSSAQPTGYQATFPDLPDCAAEGANLAELLVHARQRLVSCLEAIEGDGEVWPPATPIEAFTAQPGVMTIPIDVAVDDPPIRVNISLGERLVQRLDAAAEARGMTRSGFIAQSVRASLGETTRGAGDFDAMGRRVQDELTALGRRINESIGPDSPFTRRMNEFDGVLYEGVRRAADSVSAAMARRRDASKPSERANGDNQAMPEPPSNPS